MSPTGRYTTLVPLIFILSVSAIKEIIEDFVSRFWFYDPFHTHVSFINILFDDSVCRNVTEPTMKSIIEK